MREKKMKRIIGLILAFVLALSVCACGKEEGTSGGKEEVDLNAASKQYVYSYENIDMGIEDMSIYGMAYRNDRLYVLVEDYTGQFLPAAGARTVVSSSKARLAAAAGVSVVEESAEVEVAVEETAVDEASIADDDIAGGEVIDTPIIDEGFGMGEPEMSYTGPVYVLISTKLDGTDRTEAVLEIPDQKDGFWLNRIDISADGSVTATLETYEEDLSNPEAPIWQSLTYLVHWGEDGAILWKKDIKEFVGEVDYYYPSQMFSDENGTVTFFSYDGLGASVDKDGNLVQNISFDSTIAPMIANIVRNKDGKVYVTSYNDEWTKMFISTFDVTTGTMGEKIELPGNMQNYSFYTGYNTDFLLTANSGVYTYNIGDEAPVQIMDYINSDFPSTYINNVAMLDEDHLIGYYHDDMDYKTRFAYFTKVNPEDVPDKKTLVIGCNYIDYNIRRRVIAFNKSNANYRIAIKDYSTYSTMEDYMAGYTQFNNDIISGNVPDILVANTNFNLSTYAEKGVLADIGELIANDEELSQEEYLTNVFDAVSVNGKLYTVIPSFSIQTMIGKKSNLGGKTTWTMQDFMEISNSLPEDASMFGSSMLRDSFIYQILNYLGSDFVDPVTGQCHFDSEDFIALLEYANTFPAEYEEDYWENYDYTLYENMYREDKAILMELYMSSIQDLKYYLKGQFGEPVSFIGFPSAQGMGSTIEPSYVSLALSAKSKNLDGAWEFVRYYLTDEYQNSDQFYEFPVSKEAFLAKAAKATEKPYWEDENGEKHYYDDTYYINGEEIILDPFTQEEVDEICEFIYSVNKTSDFKEEIRAIIVEEAQYFFEGQKSAREAAAIIQSRAQLYMDENS